MKLAAIDIGTNSIHMVVVRVDRGGRFEVVDRFKEMAKLGKRTLSEGALPEEAMDRGLACLHRMKKLSEAHGCGYVVAAATSAVREAENRADFLARIQDETGIKVRVLRGLDEAALIFRAVQDGLDLSRKKCLVLDLGGGSTEVIVGNSFGTHLVESLPLGIIRMTEEFAQNPGVTSAKRYSALAKRVREIAGPLLEQARAVGFDMVVGTSGTFKCLGEMLAPPGDLFGDIVHLPPLRLDDLGRLVEELQSKSQPERAEMRKMNPKRASNIAVGGTIIYELLALSGATEARLSNRALRDGLVLEAIRTLPELDTPERRGRDLRRRAVTALARRHGGDLDHGRHVANLALQLFDQTGGLHGLEVGERELLRYAALLHDIGLSAGYTKHHKHGFYLLTNAELAGFDPGEVLEMALVARYHRKSLPSADHEEFARLPKPRRKAVAALAALLRVADGLDRTHRGAVRGLQLRHDPDRLTLVAETRGDAELELHAAAGKADLFEKLWEKPLTFEARPAPDDAGSLLELTEVHA